MIKKNSPSLESSKQTNHKEQINHCYQEGFKRDNKFILDDSEFIENYNNALKSPQSRRLYKDTENEIHLDSIEAQNILPLDKISI
jgi:uncharacterized protein YifE (UPF0438 family)